MPKLPIGRVASSLNCVGWNRQFGAGAALTEITMTASVPGDNDRGKTEWIARADDLRTARQSTSVVRMRRVAP
jgi:hypothetical protein